MSSATPQRCAQTCPPVDVDVGIRVTDYANLCRISGNADPNNTPGNDKLRAETVTLIYMLDTDEIKLCPAYSLGIAQTCRFSGLIPAVFT